jgi:hypothetical protein
VLEVELLTRQALDFWLVSLVCSLRQWPVRATMRDNHCLRFLAMFWSLHQEGAGTTV